MSDKITKKYAFTASGVLDISTNDLLIDVEDKGEYSLRKVLVDFNGKAVKISVSYDEDYEEPAVNAETGELID